MPHPVSLDQPGYTFEQWNGIRNLVTAPATALHDLYVGIIKQLTAN